MLRSLYSGVSGLKSFQTDLDVVANNIANTNTVGYKSSRVVFQDLISQTVSNASSPTTTSGGINAKQVGLGTEVGSIDTDTSAGSPETTDSDLDLYIDGNGYFAVEGTGENAQTYYTRNGDFELDSDKNLVTSDGLKVLGWTEDATEYTGSDTVSTSGTPSTISIPSEVDGEEYSDGSLAIDSSGILTATYGSTKYVLGQVALATFNNAGGLEKVGSSLYETSSNSGTANYTTAGDDGTGSLVSGELEMSNVDLSSEFTEMIIANRAYQANAKVITTSDEILQVLTNLKQS
ncbi:flagellar hook-basal body complex protein [Liquorilactobacillus sicerae]|uniref:flagellar hook-basal body complex protein n=1 Tax=Liquorilactobacillus sicerae TaxID=1416943 RepID=UPI0024811299|nr:flagellar hook-basal body complex protein [Liquorilactobacillus sicerae]